MWWVTNRRWFCLLSAAVLVCPARLCAGESDPLAAIIERHSVQSTHLASIGYLAESRLLEIEFQNGAVYRYVDVPPAVVDALLRAESKGHYFAHSIRGHFQFHLVTKAVR